MAARSSAATAAAPTTDRELWLERVFEAPRALVFQAWTDPTRATHWWGPQGYTTLLCEVDARVGGAFRVRLRSPKGSVHTKRGVYREVLAPERLVFTYAWDDAEGRPGPQTIVTVRFAAEGARTRLTLHQALFETVTSCDQHRGGWTSCLDRFEGWLGGRA